MKLTILLTEDWEVTIRVVEADFIAFELLELE